MREWDADIEKWLPGLLIQQVSDRFCWYHHGNDFVQSFITSIDQLALVTTVKIDFNTSRVATARVTVHAVVNGIPCTTTSSLGVWNTQHQVME